MLGTYIAYSICAAAFVAVFLPIVLIPEVTKEAAN
jgi:hypothetical protein